MVAVDEKDLTFREQRALYFARNAGRTKTRILLLYVGAAFFAFNAIASTFFIHPLKVWDFSGFVFLAAAFWAAHALRRLLREGEQMLADRNETVVRPKLRDLRRKPVSNKSVSKPRTSSRA